VCLCVFRYGCLFVFWLILCFMHDLFFCLGLVVITRYWLEILVFEMTVYVLVESLSKLNSSLMNLCPINSKAVAVLWCWLCDAGLLRDNLRLEWSEQMYRVQKILDKPHGRPKWEISQTEQVLCWIHLCGSLTITSELEVPLLARGGWGVWS